MEQIRVALAWIVKYHFWLLSVLVILLSTGVWYMAAGDLDTRKDDNLKKIDGAFLSQQQVKSRPLHANPEVNRQQALQNVALADETKAIWQQLYDRQRKDVLKWPAQLPEGFRREVEKKQFGDEISLNRRAQYTDYIVRRFPDLPKIVDANEIDENAAAGGGGGRGGGFGAGEFGGARGAGSMELDENGNPIEVDYTVFWSPEDQARIRADLDWPTTQSYWRIWVTQEDLWVYETMLRAIAATNEAKGSDRHSNAAVQVIYALQVGRDAAKESRTSGRITRLQTATAGGEGEFVGRGAEVDSSSMEGEFVGRGGGIDGGEATLDPAMEKALRLSQRYIDGEGQPVEVAADEEPLSPDAFGQEVKRLPVRLALEMDTRWLTRLMTELANADLQIKVTEVRVNPQDAETGGAGGGRGGGFGGEFGAGGGRGGFGGGGFGAEELLVFDRKPYIKPVVIQGVVLIFNPPNEQILQVDQGEASPDSLTSL